MSRATQIERIIAKGQLVPLVFNQDAVAATQTDVQLATVDGAGAVGITMPFDGEIVAITADLSAAASAGSLTCGPTIGGTEKTDLTVTFATETAKRAKVNRGKVPFVAGDVVGAEITASGTWNATTADLSVTIWVLLSLEGI
jgi:hypothetical protein